jgi:hypothetical protein
MRAAADLRGDDCSVEPDEVALGVEHVGEHM